MFPNWVFFESAGPDGGKKKGQVRLIDTSQLWERLYPGSGSWRSPFFYEMGGGYWKEGRKRKGRNGTMRAPGCAGKKYESGGGGGADGTSGGPPQRERKKLGAFDFLHYIHIYIYRWSCERSCSVQ